MIWTGFEAQRTWQSILPVTDGNSYNSEFPFARLQRFLTLDNRPFSGISTTLPLWWLECYSAAHG
jgi:hypothetical protein